MSQLAGDAAGVLPSTTLTSAVALVGATGVAVGVGVFSLDPGDEPRDEAANIVASDAEVDQALAGRVDDQPAQVSRSATRPALLSVQRADKARAMPLARQSMKGSLTEKVEPTDPRDIALLMLDDYGWSTDQFSCLDELYMHESGWDPSAENPSSGAYGIPQSLPADKMAAYGADYQTNPETQLEWGLAYIQDRYGSPCGAWSYWQSHNWY